MTSTQSNRTDKCLRCQRTRVIEARGLCGPCYLHVRRRRGLKAYPRKNLIAAPPITGDPLIRWTFQEIIAQGKTMKEVCHTAGISHNLRTWRQHGNPYFQNFRAVIEALGYEIRIVAKEPAEASNENV